MSVASLVVLGGMIVASLYGVGVYNGLVAARNRFRNAFAQIDVQLKRRYDLIPNLVEAAKGYMQHERATLEAVMAARSQAQSAARDAAERPEDAAAVSALSVAERGLGGALGKFYAVAEAYPALKADAAIDELMTALSATEDRLAAARGQFNDAVTDFNNSREQFPHNLLASMFAFATAELLTLDEPAAREAPRISFG